jgi:hypothetical protein
MQMYYFHALFNNSKLKSQKRLYSLLNFEFCLFNLNSFLMFTFTKVHLKLFNQFIQ